MSKCNSEATYNLGKTTARWECSRAPMLSSKQAWHSPFIRIGQSWYKRGKFDLSAISRVDTWSCWTTLSHAGTNSLRSYVSPVVQSIQLEPIGILLPISVRLL